MQDLAVSNRSSSLAETLSKPPPTTRTSSFPGSPALTVLAEQTVLMGRLRLQQPVASVPLIASTSAVSLEPSSYGCGPIKTDSSVSAEEKMFTNEEQPKKMTVTYFISLLT